VCVEKIRKEGKVRRWDCRNDSNLKSQKMLETLFFFILFEHHLYHNPLK